MYGKLFRQMYHGTLATTGPWQALVTFQQLIVLADAEGVVDMTPQSISRETTIPLDIIQAGLVALEQPDPDSRSPDEEGRRIVRLSPTRAWGWRIVNYLHYRTLQREEERRAYHRQYWHIRKGRSSTGTQQNGVEPQTTQRTQPMAEAEAYAEAEGLEKDKRATDQTAARSTAKGTRCPYEELGRISTAEVIEWAKVNAPDVDLKLALAEFVDYWRGVPGARGRKLDWPATFRNRLRELQSKPRQRQVARGPVLLPVGEG